MIQFTVRVELHDSTDPNDYQLLYEEMEKVGFSKTIELNNTLYYLPSGEYNLIANIDIDDVSKLAGKAIKKVGKDFELLVTQGIRQGYKLKKV